MKTKAILFLAILSAGISISAARFSPANITGENNLDGTVTKRFGVYVEVTGSPEGVANWPEEKDIIEVWVPKKGQKKSTSKSKKVKAPIVYDMICKAEVYKVRSGQGIIEFKVTESFEAAAQKKGYEDMKLAKELPIRLSW